MSKWSIENIPNLSGQIVVITGANSGLGYATSEALAKNQATVILACRSLEKGEAAKQAILQESPGASLRVMQLDLSSLTSIRAFAEAYKQEYDTLNILINNAGVMALPHKKTADGFEMQFGTNHLGHFALTGLLVNRLQATPNSRVVTVSSGLHRRGRLEFDNLQGEKSYDKWQAYSNSKIANLYFTYELQRRLAKAGASTMSTAAHPGYAATNLQQAGPEMSGSRVQKWFMSLANRFVAQSAEMGALPQLYAAVSLDVVGGDYIGPNGRNEMKGHPTKVRSVPLSYDEQIAAKLWQVSETLTGIQYL